MECPYCGAELICTDHYGTGRQEHYYGTAANGLYYPSTYQKQGDIYKCPNSEGYEDVEILKEGLGLNNDDELEKYMVSENIKDWEDICCESGCFNGNFYTDSNEELYEGYPC
jgi:hypothetical protein